MPSRHVLVDVDVVVDLVVDVVVAVVVIIVVDVDLDVVVDAGLVLVAVVDVRAHPVGRRERRAFLHGTLTQVRHGTATGRERRGNSTG
ncbi:MAG: hypothetical protein HYX74_09270 [Acidobacteria bacterium]|nr:hypothetical protein [Acidobacteriota bacterium]